MSKGLPYGWWKSGEFWATTLSLLSLLSLMGTLAAIIAAWFLDWKPMW